MAYIKPIKDSVIDLFSGIIAVIIRKSSKALLVSFLEGLHPDKENCVITRCDQVLSSRPSLERGWLTYEV